MSPGQRRGRVRRFGLGATQEEEVSISLFFLLFSSVIVVTHRIQSQSRACQVDNGSYVEEDAETYDERVITLSGSGGEKEGETCDFEIRDDGGDEKTYETGYDYSIHYETSR